MKLAWASQLIVLVFPLLSQAVLICELAIVEQERLKDLQCVGRQGSDTGWVVLVHQQDSLVEQKKPTAFLYFPKANIWCGVVVSIVALQKDGSWLDSRLGLFGVFTCVCMFSPGAPVSSHGTKTCMLGSVTTLKLTLGLSVNADGFSCRLPLCAPVMCWWPVQGEPYLRVYTP